MSDTLSSTPDTVKDAKPHASSLETVTRARPSNASQGTPRPLDPGPLVERQDPAPPGEPGDALLTRYEVLGLAGSGGMGDVYRARDRASGKPVALKVLRGEDGDSRRFAREAAVLRALEHPGVVRYEAHGVTEEG